MYSVFGFLSITYLGIFKIVMAFGLSIGVVPILKNLI